MKNTLLFISSFFLLSSCNETQQALSHSSRNYNIQKGKQVYGYPYFNQSRFCYSGLITVDNNTLLFFDCSNGQTYPIMNNEISSDLLCKFEEFDTTKTKTLSTEFIGHFDNQKEKNRIVISKINSITSDNKCSSSSIAIGIYLNQNKNYKVKINLMSNHAFIANIYSLNSNHIEQRTVGTWKMLSEKEISLYYEPDNKYISHTLYFDNTTHNIIYSSKMTNKLMLTREK